MSVRRSWGPCGGHGKVRRDAGVSVGGGCWWKLWGAAPGPTDLPNRAAGPARAPWGYFFLEPRLDAFKGLILACAWAAVSSLTWVAKLQWLVFHLTVGLG